MNDKLFNHYFSCLEHHKDAVLDEFVHQLQYKFGESIASVIFYGSCLRSGVYLDAMLDFYVIVDNYRDAYKHLVPAIANKFLPPNVYYLQIEHNNSSYRAKYAVVSKTDLLKSVSESSFHSYFWARFTQPIGYTFIRDQDEKQWIANMQSLAARTFFKKVAPMLQEKAKSEEFWITGLQLTYSAELRTETSKRAITIYQSNQHHYDKVSKCIDTNQLLDNVIKSNRIIPKISWKARIIIGKILSVLRLMKASITFANGVDYIAWKIERHTGEKVEITNNVRKHPWLFSWPVIFRLFRSGKIR